MRSETHVFSQFRYLELQCEKEKDRFFFQIFFSEARSNLYQQKTSTFQFINAYNNYKAGNRLHLSGYEPSDLFRRAKK